MYKILPRVSGRTHELTLVLHDLHWSHGAFSRDAATMPPFASTVLEAPELTRCSTRGVAEGFPHWELTGRPSPWTHGQGGDSVV